MQLIGPRNNPTRKIEPVYQLVDFNGEEWFYGTLADARDCFFSNCDSEEDLIRFGNMHNSLVIRVRDRSHLRLVK